jgi:hypothetical protein
MSEMQTTNSESIRFLGEQDGEAERALKSELVKYFKSTGDVESAYLAVIESGRGPSVTLCLRHTGGRESVLASGVGEVFSRLFRTSEHLDIIFLNEGQRAEISKVCPPFFAADQR